MRRVMLWHEHGTDIDQAMLALSTYMGHAKISNTYWYLTAVPELMAALEPLRSKFEFVDIGKIQAHRIYDLLGLYDRASALITVDSATLHLAEGGQIPRIAFVQNGWGGSLASRSLLQIRYDDACRKGGDVAMALKGALGIDGTAEDDYESDRKPARNCWLFERPSSIRRRIYSPNEDAIIKYYRNVVPIKRRPMPAKIPRLATVIPTGLGDNMMLTDLVYASWLNRRKIRVCSSSRHLDSLMAFNPYYEAAQNWASQPINLPEAISEYDCGNGHYLQRIRRLFDLPVDDLPKGFLKVTAVKDPALVVLHFDPGVHSEWQRRHIHPRARFIYQQTRAALEQFIKSRRDLKFVEVGENPIKLEGTTWRKTETVNDLVEFMATTEWFLGIISGPMHVAAALGVKSVVIINFPEPEKIYLPTLVTTGQVEEEWFYPQNVHLHQEGEGAQVKQATLDNFKRAFNGEIYPFWSDRYLSLIHEDL